MEVAPIRNDSLIFGRQTTLSLVTFHPTVPRIFQLWQAYLNNVNPLVKLFHAPSVQQMILEAVADLVNVRKSTEALMFAYYLCSVVSMSDEDYRKLIREPKATLLIIFANATQQALVNAEFLKSADLVVLQALTLYLVSFFLMPNVLKIFLTYPVDE